MARLQEIDYYIIANINLSYHYFLIVQSPTISVFFTDFAVTN